MRAGSMGEDARVMYLVGARFADLDSASAARDALRDEFEVGPGDLGLRPLGSVRYEEPARDLVVAGRFELADVDAVVSLMQRHGGEIVFRRPEWRSRAAGSGNDRSAGRCQQFSRLRT